MRMVNSLKTRGKACNKCHVGHNAARYISGYEIDMGFTHEFSNFCRAPKKPHAF